MKARRKQSAPRSRMARADRRKQLLGVANELLANEGMYGLTMERLSEEAKISKPVVYSHFPNRSELLVAMLADYWQGVDLSLVDFDYTQSFEVNFRSLVKSYFDYVSKKHAAIRQVLYKVVEDPIVEAARKRRERQVIDRWGDRLSHFCSLSKVELETAALMFRGVQANAASQIIQSPRRRKYFEEMTIVMGLALFSSLMAN